MPLPPDKSDISPKDPNLIPKPTSDEHLKNILALQNPDPDGNVKFPDYPRGSFEVNHETMTTKNVAVGIQANLLGIDLKSGSFEEFRLGRRLSITFIGTVPTGEKMFKEGLNDSDNEIDLIFEDTANPQKAHNIIAICEIRAYLAQDRQLEGRFDFFGNGSYGGQTSRNYVERKQVSRPRKVLDGDTIRDHARLCEADFKRATEKDEHGRGGGLLDDLTSAMALKIHEMEYVTEKADCLFPTPEQMFGRTVLHGVGDAGPDLSKPDAGGCRESFTLRVREEYVRSKGKGVLDVEAHYRARWRKQFAAFAPAGRCIQHREMPAGMGICALRGSFANKCPLYRNASGELTGEKIDHSEGRAHVRESLTDSEGMLDCDAAVGLECRPTGETETRMGIARFPIGRCMFSNNNQKAVRLPGAVKEKIGADTLKK